MGTYFKPWRRKLGLVTLFVTCVLAPAWVRSLKTMDLIYLNRSGTTYTVVSGGGKFQVFQSFIFKIQQFSTSKGIAIKFIKDQRMTNFGNTNSWFHRSWPATSFGVYSGVDGVEREIAMFHYWLIVLPLTLLSAWLLLSKPRPPKAANSKQATPS